MRFLGVDTSSSLASVAITENGRLVTENVSSADGTHLAGAVRSRTNHAQFLLSLIDATLKAADLSLRDLSGFAVTIGPGSFTGLRIALSTVKGLAYGSDSPVIGISTLHASAARACDFNGFLCAILDARKQEIYGAFFSRWNGTLQRLTPDAVMSLEQLVAALRGFDSGDSILLTGDGIKQYGELLTHHLGDRIRLQANGHRPTIASAVALLGEATLATNECGFASPAGPLYLRAPEAELRQKNWCNPLKLGR
jgi:tRNA threonylcarbamoyladenosine biosynthesis protein TsaB